MEIKRKGDSSVLKVNEKGDLVYLTFPELSKEAGFVHGFSTRLGGVSKEHLYSMNLSFSRGDDPENVKENYRRLSEAIGFQTENLVFSDQTHTKNIRKVTEADRGKGIIKERDYTDVDGLITNEKNLVLATFFADCVPLFFIDPVHKAIGLSHSGWKGTVQKIGKATVEKMTQEYGTDPKDIIAAIGPSICQDCYEVSEDVILQFQQVFPEKDWADLLYAKENGKFQLNLWEANHKIMLEAGITEEHISITDICTCCNPELLYSHRASKGMRGNLGAFLMIL